MASDFENILNERVLLLDGSMGVMLRKHGGTNPAMLSLSRPDLVAGVHDAYLAAGADIIETNSFTANALSQRMHGSNGRIAEMNRAAARIAVASTRASMKLDPSRPRFAGGSMGPAVDPPSSRGFLHPECVRDFDLRKNVYAEQASALIEGGVDLLMVETMIDAVDAGCALAGAREAMIRTGKTIPVTVSATISATTGKLMSGHSPEEFLESVAPYGPAAVGFNCSEGPASIADAARRFARLSSFPLILYPNAGLPDADGNYSLGPEEFVTELAPLLADNLPGIAGGCCGTGPAHTAALRRHLDKFERNGRG